MVEIEARKPPEFTTVGGEAAGGPTGLVAVMSVVRVLGSVSVLGEEEVVVSVEAVRFAGLEDGVPDEAREA